MKKFSAIVVAVIMKLMMPYPVFSESSVKPLEVDPTTGNASFSFALEVPPGRSGVQPTVALEYNSSFREGMLGLGWNMELGSIQRSTKKGVPRYDGTDSFVITQSGGTQELVYDASVNFYRPQIEGAFMKIEKNGDSWLATDPKGTKYYFGQTDNSRITDTPGTFHWHLDRVEDINGNFLTVTYVNYGNQTLYPEKIEYTGYNGSTPNPPFARIIFEIEDRPDVIRSYKSGYLVETAKRIDKIKTFVQGNLQKVYDLTYQQSPLTQRSLLTRITTYGSDGITSLPPITFRYQDSDMGYQLAGGWTIPTGTKFSQQQGSRWQDLGVRLVDVNTDGFPDLVKAYTDCSGNTVKEIYLHNRQNGWDLTNQWSLPAGLPGFVKGCSDQDRDKGVRFVDMNGDGWVDIVWFLYNTVTGVVEKHVYLNNKTNGWIEGSWDFPNEMAMINVQNTPTADFHQYMGVQIADINGDGYPDLIKAKEGQGILHKTYLNKSADNQGWVYNSKWTPFGSENNQALTDFAQNGNIVDLNGDGLPELFFNNGQNIFGLNTGTGWINAIYPWINTDGYDATSQFVDINGDGWEDLFTAKGGYDKGSRVFLNKGNGWVQMNAWILPEADFQNLGTRIVDVNGDSLPDILIHTDGNPPKLYLNKGKVPDLLIEINNGMGGKTAIEYEASTDCEHTFFPFHIQVVKSITVMNGFGNTYVTQYKYCDGLWDTVYREFRGFGTVKIIDPDGNYVQTRYLQDNIFKGHPQEQAFYDVTGKLFSKTVNVWSSEPISSGSNFVFLERQDQTIYDANSTGRRKAELYFYNDRNPQLGHLTKKVQLGEVDLNTGTDIPGDTRTVDTVYTKNTAASNWLHGLPKTIALYDQDGNKVGQSWFYYDGNTGVDNLPTKGLLTKKEEWLGIPGQNNPTINYSYDSYGNILSTKDPNGNTTTTTYDGTYFLFPLLTKNALNHTSTTEFYGVNGVPLSSGGLSGLWGQSKSLQDPNLQKEWKSYDALGRPIVVVGPLDNVQYPTTTINYDTTTQYLKITKKQRMLTGQAATRDSVEFYDGLGRLIQTKTKSELVGRFIVGGHTEYNSKGLPTVKYLPFFVTTPQDSIDPTEISRAHSMINYDAMGRIVQTINPDGTFASTVYDDWTASTIDENGHKQTAYFDAYGRLTKKEEYVGADGRSSQYPTQNYAVYATTLYAYDAKDDLIRTQDALGNVATINYDKLGRKIAMNDPDMHNWQYGYDANGNLLWQIDAKGKKINFTYDVLNRLKKKSDGGSLNVTYTYDDPAKNFSKGRLTQVQYPSGKTQFAYDVLGRETNSTKTINSLNYKVQRNYDAFNRLLTIQYPGVEKVFYKYNNAGEIEAVANDQTLLN